MSKSETKTEKPKIKVKITPSEFGEVRDIDPADMVNCGWTDHPGEGIAIMLPDERDNPAYEVPSPLQFAPPIGYQPTPPLHELIKMRVRQELTQLKGDEEVDTEADQNDFEIDDDIPDPTTIYEVVAMKEEAPRIPPADPKAELTAKARADLDYWEEIEKERLLRKRHREETIRQQKAALDESELYGSPKKAEG